MACWIITKKATIASMVLSIVGTANGHESNPIALHSLSASFVQSEMHEVKLHPTAAAFTKYSGVETDVATNAYSDAISCRGGGILALIPAGCNPFGYKITELGESFLGFEGSLDSDVGRFLASVKSRKKLAELKSQWLEIVRVSKSAQTMRIYRTMDDLIAFCIKARLLD